MTTPCKFYVFDVHNAGTIDATLTWSNPDTWLGLRLQGCVDYECAESWSSQSRVGLSQRLTVNTVGGANYYLAVEYLSGTEITPFTLTAIRPN